MDTRESSRQVKLLEERYHEIHRYARLVRARLAELGAHVAVSGEELYRGQEELAEAERDKRAILVAIEEIEDALLE
ncbi:MAG TPA: hypothetical protein VI653_30555 [Steroidobacteraceae bacterium]